MKKLIYNWNRLWPWVFNGFCASLLIILIAPVFPIAPDTANPGLPAADPEPGSEKPVIAEELCESAPDPVLEPEYPTLVFKMHQEQDIILEIYHDIEFRDMVTAFFGQVCGSPELASLILANAAEYNISPALAFSLCWEESRYNPGAVNTQNRNLTVDRGLFQLNEASFPKLTEKDFFDPETNTRHGLAHLRWCLDTAGTEVAGLAMYNAGANRVSTGGTPKNTLDYVSRIINRQRRIDEFFLLEFARSTKETEILVIKEKEPALTLSLLAPLGAR